MLQREISHTTRLETPENGLRFSEVPWILILTIVALVRTENNRNLDVDSTMLEILLNAL